MQNLDVQAANELTFYERQEINLILVKGKEIYLSHAAQEQEKLKALHKNIDLKKLFKKTILKKLEDAEIELLTDAKSTNLLRNSVAQAFQMNLASIAIKMVGKNDTYDKKIKYEDSSSSIEEEVRVDKTLQEVRLERIKKFSKKFCVPEEYA